MHRFALMIVLTCVSVASAQLKLAANDIGPLVIPKGNGALAVVCSDTGAVELFHSVWDAEPYARTQAGRNPIQAIVKRHNGKSLVVVRSAVESVVTVVDVTRAQVIARPAPVGGVSSISADLREDSPYVYYVSSRRGSNNGVGRINVVTGLDEGLLEGSIEGNPAIQMLDDASLIYVSGASSNEHNLIGLRIEESKGKGEKARLITEFWQKAGGGVITVHPRGLWIGVQTTRLDQYADFPIGSLHAVPHCFLRKGNAFFTNESPKIRARSGNDCGVLGEVDPKAYLPQPPAPPAPQGGSNVVAPRPPVAQPLNLVGSQPLTLDEESGLLLVRYDGGIIPIPLAHFGVLDEPFVGARLGRTSAVVDQEMVADLQLADAATQGEIKDAPEGVSVKDGKLHWKPTAKQIGLHRISLHLRQGAIVVEQKVEISVRRPWVWLPFRPGSVALTPDSRAAICVVDPPSSDVPKSDISNGRICAVDVQSWKCVGEYKPDSKLNRFAVHNKYVFASVGDTGVVKVLQVPTLEERGEIRVSGRCSSMWVAGDTLWLIVPNYSTTGNTLCYSVDTLKPKTVVPQRLLLTNDTSATTYWETVTYGGIIYDAKTMKPIGLTDTFSLNPERTNTRPRLDAVWRYRHGVAVTPEGVVNTSRAVVASTRSDATAVLPDVAAWVTARMDGESGSRSDPLRPSRRRLALGAREIATLGEQPPIILQEEPQRRSPDDPVHGLNPIGIDAGKGVVAVGYGERLFLVPTSELGIDKIAAPLEAVEPPSRMDAPVGVVTKIDLKAAGGTAPYKWELIKPLPGFQIKDGTVLEINPSEFAANPSDAVLETARAANRPAGARIDKRPGDEPPARVRDRLNAALGLSLKHPPVVVPVRFRVTDSANHTLEVGWSFVVELDERQLQEQLGAAVGAPEPAGNVTDGPHRDEDAAPKKRIAELEAENAKLRAGGGKQ